MPTVREKLMAVVGADISQYARAVGRQVPAIAKRAASSVKRIGSVGARAFKVLGSAARAATGAISGVASVIRSGLRKAVLVGTVALTAATAEAVGFQHAMAEVASISDQVRANIHAQSRAVADLGVKYGKVPKEMAGALYQTISAGITDPKEAMKFLEVASKAGVAGLTDVRTAVDVLTSAVNAYGKTAGWAGHVSDVLFTTVREGKTTLPELASTMGRVMAIGAQTGVSIEELGAAIATLTKGGVATDLAVTSLRQTLVSVLKPGKEATDLAKELGIDFSAQALAAKGLGGFLEEVRKATRGHAEAMATLFPNVRALTGVMNLAGSQSREFARQLKVMGGAAGATEKAFGVMADTTKFRLAQAWASIRTSFGKIGEVLLPTVEAAVTGIASLVGKGAEWVEGHAKEIEYMLRGLWYRVVDGLKWLQASGLEVLNVIKADHATTWGAINAAMDKAADWMAEFWEGMKQTLRPAWQGLLAIMQGDWKKGLGGLVDAAVNVIDDIVNALTKEDRLKRFVQAGIDMVDRLMTGLRNKETLKKFGGLVADIAGVLLSPENLKRYFEWGKIIGGGIASGIWEAMGEAYQEWNKDPLGWGAAIKAKPYPEHITQADYAEPPPAERPREAAPKSLTLTQNFFYPTDREAHEKLSSDVARLQRRGRARPAPNF